MGDRNDGNGNGKEVVEHHITVDRIRQCPPFVPNLHHHNINHRNINALVPGQYVELLWRGRASHPWGNWLGQLGRVDRISPGRTRLTLLFSQYQVGSPWRCVYIHLDDAGDDDDVVEDEEEDGGDDDDTNNTNSINTTTTINIKDYHQYGVPVNDNPLFGYIGGLYVVDGAGLEEWKRAASHHHLHEKQRGGDDVEEENAPLEEEYGGEESILNEGTSAQ